MMFEGERLPFHPDDPHVFKFLIADSVNILWDSDGIWTDGEPIEYSDGPHTLWIKKNPSTKREGQFIPSKRLKIKYISADRCKLVMNVLEMGCPELSICSQDGMNLCFKTLPCNDIWISFRYTSERAQCVVKPFEGVWPFKFKAIVGGEATFDGGNCCFERFVVIAEECSEVRNVRANYFDRKRKARRAVVDVKPIGPKFLPSH